MSQREMTCLVVDDSAVIRKVARRIIEDFGYAVVEAEDGDSALAICAESMPDLILLDWNMPNRDGYAFLQELRQTEAGKRPKVVFCTTENDVGAIARALRGGADEYIMKPFDRDILTAKLEQVGLSIRTNTDFY
ncbi:response regulator [Methylobacterium persicinum]|uniref:Two-component system chemotaxis response regulator CheY n=1 Tax=Methylobacterium persicinum TaxID=374426 RepID=A0ABU0HN80_9HYPH|nr:response regulator [Methylobacterium persicinum]MDQ0443775.1 two-component system chemotaxis response regulator CheY [Methylobacterium persicinum]GJE37466.1 Phosphate regulon transcriptional regulatory protein PhoB [Methylobacterium persicinum]